MLKILLLVIAFLTAFILGTSMLFFLLSLVSIACLMIGLINPTVFCRFFGGEITRKKIAAIFTIATVAFFILVAITRPGGTKYKQDPIKIEKQIDKN